MSPLMVHTIWGLEVLRRVVYYYFYFYVNKGESGTGPVNLGAILKYLMLIIEVGGLWVQNIACQGCGGGGLYMREDHLPVLTQRTSLEFEFPS